MVSAPGQVKSTTWENVKDLDKKKYASEVHTEENTRAEQKTNQVRDDCGFAAPDFSGNTLRNSNKQMHQRRKQSKIKFTHLVPRTQV